MMEGGPPQMLGLDALGARWLRSAREATQIPSLADQPELARPLLEHWLQELAEIAQELGQKKLANQFKLAKAEDLSSEDGIRAAYQKRVGLMEQFERLLTQ